MHTPKDGVSAVNVEEVCSRLSRVGIEKNPKQTPSGAEPLSTTSPKRKVKGLSESRHYFNQKRGRGYT